MNYSLQEKFFNLYAQIGVGLIALSIMSTVLLCNKELHFANLLIVITTSLLIAVLSYIVYYIPKYLFLTIEDRKKFFWIVRIRWIIISTFLLCVVFCKSIFGVIILSVSVLLLLLVNWLLNKYIKYGFSKVEVKNCLKYIPFIYLLTDCFIAWFLLITKSLTPIVGILVLALIIHLFVLLLELRELKYAPVGLFLGIGILLTVDIIGPYIGVLTLWGTTSIVLCWFSASHHYSSLGSLIVSLVNFTGESEEQVHNLLKTSTPKLAESWHSLCPTSPEDLENWYRVNSGYYVYDLAQFHLTYKHIMFSLDVIRLSSGRILDYGAGIGDIALELSSRGFQDITHFDVDGESQRYAKWKAKEQKLKLNFVNKNEDLRGGYDTIILLDVLEHLPEPEKILEFLINHLAYNGILIASIAFGATKAHPMHFDHKLDVEVWLRNRGLKNVKNWRLKLFGSELMRKKNVIIYKKSK